MEAVCPPHFPHPVSFHHAQLYRHSEANVAVIRGGPDTAPVAAEPEHCPSVVGFAVTQNGKNYG